jgi:N-methylhydantoinase B
VHDNESIVVESPGAGGYGSPSERSLDAISADQSGGKFSKKFIAQNYGARRAAE